MEVDHRVLVGGGAETLRGSSACHAWHLAESSYSTTPRTDSRWNRASTTDWRDPGACRVFADRLRSLSIAPGGGYSTLGQISYGTLHLSDLIKAI